MLIEKMPSFDFYQLLDGGNSFVEAFLPDEVFVL